MVTLLLVSSTRWKFLCTALGMEVGGQRVYGFDDLSLTALHGVFDLFVY
jgi:hypothetical protein